MTGEMKELGNAMLRMRKAWEDALATFRSIIVRKLNPQGGAAADEAAGPVSQATEGSVSVTFQLPTFGSSAFSALLLGTPPYGPLLLSLLQISASVGPYISSGRFSLVPP